MKVRRKIVGITKIDRISSQQIRKFCGILSINEWVQRRRKRRRRREWGQGVTRMDAERLVQIAENLQDALKEDGRFDP